MNRRLELVEDHFVPADRAELAAAGWTVADVVRDIARDHVTDTGAGAGRWMCDGPIPDELARLKEVAAQLEDAARYVRGAVAPVERRARIKAWREDQALWAYRGAIAADAASDGGVR